MDVPHNHGDVRVSPSGLDLQIREASGIGWVPRHFVDALPAALTFGSERLPVAVGFPGVLLLLSWRPCNPDALACSTRRWKGMVGRCGT